jgi:hypothetical protein
LETPKTLDGKEYCKKCFDKIPRKCARCKKTGFARNLFKVRARTGEFPFKYTRVCRRCLEKYYERCNDCDDYVDKKHYEFTHNDSGTVVVCDSCIANHYFVCDRCGVTWHNDCLHEPTAEEMAANPEPIDICDHCAAESAAPTPPPPAPVTSAQNTQPVHFRKTNDVKKIMQDPNSEI